MARVVMLHHVGIGQLRPDWSADKFGNEISFWSRGDEEPIFTTKSGVLISGSTLFFTIAMNSRLIAFEASAQIADSNGNVSTVEMRKKFSGRAFSSLIKLAKPELIKFMRRSINASKKELDDLFFLLVGEAQEELSYNLECDWDCDLGGDQYFPDGNVPAAGGIFVDRDPPVKLSCLIDKENRIIFDENDDMDNRDERRKFAGLLIRGPRM